jgi:hypothetical protein
MGKESQVEIPEGSGNLYRYEYEESSGKTVYLGPVGKAPTLDEEHFMLALSELARKNKLEPWKGGYTNRPYTIVLFKNMDELYDSEVAKTILLKDMRSFSPGGFVVTDKIWLHGRTQKGTLKRNRVKIVSTPDSEHVFSSPLFNRALKVSGKTERVHIRTDEHEVVGPPERSPIVFEGVSGKVAIIAPIVIPEDDWDKLLDPSRASTSLR